MPLQMNTIEGSVVAPKNVKIALVASRFNDLIVDRLVGGAVDCLKRHGVDEKNITLVKVPGAWEIPVACQKLAQKKKFDAIVALGAVIRGSTPHFDMVASEVSKGVAQAALSTGVPIAFGVLTTDTIEQAVERAGTKAGNKGWDAGLSALEMISVLRGIDGT